MSVVNLIYPPMIFNVGPFCGVWSGDPETRRIIGKAIEEFQNIKVEKYEVPVEKDE